MSPRHVALAPSRGALRLRLGIAAGLLGLLAAFRSPRPPAAVTGAPTLLEVAGALGKATESQVDTADLVWGPSSGAWVDALWGRPVVFLARSSPGAPRELFEARVRLTRSGHPVEVLGRRNLSATPDGDESQLAVRGAVVAVVASDERGPRGVRVLDLGAMWSEDGAWRRLLAGLLALGPEELLQLRRDPPVRGRSDPLRIALELGRLEVGDATAAWGARVPWDEPAGVPDVLPAGWDLQRWTPAPGRLTASRFWRELGVGPLFGRAWSQVASRLRGPFRSSASPSPVPWAPAPLALPLELTRPGVPAALRQGVLASGAASSNVVAVEFDLRQLELVPAPSPTSRPTAGLPSALRRPPGTVAWIAGAGLGAGPTAAALREQGRTFGPHEPGRPTLAWDAEGPLRAGLWSPSRAKLSRVWQSGPPPWLETRSWFGKLLPERPPLQSALCVGAEGGLFYVEATEATSREVLVATAPLGCSLGFRLSASPSHVGLFLLDAQGRWSPVKGGGEREPLPLGTQGEPLSDGFYVVQRDAAPPRRADAATWAPDPGWQPEPAWLPSLWGSTRERLGTHVRVRRLPPSRFAFRLQIGQAEPLRAGLAGPPPPLDVEDEAHLALTLGLGVSPKRQVLAAGFEGRALLAPSKSPTRLLAVDWDGGLQLLEAESAALREGRTYLELPQTASAGKLLPSGRQLGPTRSRQALCVGSDRAIWLASSRFDSDEASTQVLLDVGCTEVVALDRGGRVPTLERPAEGPASRRPAEVSVLYVLGKDDLGRVEPLSP